MTYQEIKDRLAKCEFSLKCIADGSYKTKSKVKLTETTKKLTILKESLEKQLKEAEGTVRTADSGEAEKLADKGVNVDLVEPKDLETKEQEITQETELEVFEKNNTTEHSEKLETKEPQMFEDSDSEEDFEIPAFLRKQKF